MNGNAFVACNANEDIPFPYVQDPWCLMPTKQELLELLSVIQASLAVPDKEYEMYRNWLFCEAHLDGYGLEMMAEYGFVPSPEQRERALRNEQSRREEIRASSVATGYIYVMQSVVTKDLKIGRSVDPFKRLKSVQASQPHEIKLILISDLVQKPTKREKELHALFSDYRLKSEWFSPEILPMLKRVTLDGKVYFKEVEA